MKRRVLATVVAALSVTLVGVACAPPPPTNGPPAEFRLTEARIVQLGLDFQRIRLSGELQCRGPELTTGITGLVEVSASNGAIANNVGLPPWILTNCDQKPNATGTWNVTVPIGSQSRRFIPGNARLERLTFRWPDHGDVDYVLGPQDITLVR